MASTNYFPNFKYSAIHVLKFLAASELFTIMLKNGEIVQFIPNDPDAFKKWLEEHEVQNIREEDGWVIDKRP